MPILPRDEMFFPADLLSVDSDPLRKWWVMHSKPRQEKALARDVRQLSIPYFLPLLERTLPDSRVTSFIPMFPGYVFVFGSDEERLRTLTTNRIAKVLPVLDQPRLWADLRQVNRLLEIKAPLTLEPRLMKGCIVRVCTGPMMGLVGTVASLKSRMRLILSVDFLQQGISVEISEKNVEPWE